MEETKHVLRFFRKYLLVALIAEIYFIACVVLFGSDVSRRDALKMPKDRSYSIEVFYFGCCLIGCVFQLVFWVHRLFWSKKTQIRILDGDRLIADEADKIGGEEDH